MCTCRVISLVFAGLLGPLGVLDGSGIIVGQEGSQRWLTTVGALHLAQCLLDLDQETLGDGFGSDDLAGLGSALGSHCDDWGTWGNFCWKDLLVTIQSKEKKFKLPHRKRCSVMEGHSSNYSRQRAKKIQAKPLQSRDCPSYRIWNSVMLIASITGQCSLVAHLELKPHLTLLPPYYVIKV